MSRNAQLGDQDDVQRDQGRKRGKEREGLAFRSVTSPMVSPKICCHHCPILQLANSLL